MEFGKNTSTGILNISNPKIYSTGILQLDELQRRIHLKSSECTREQEKVKQLRDHMHAVRQEIDNCASLIELRESNIEAEKHQQKIIEREEGRMKVELEKLKNLREEVRERKCCLENLAFTKRTELENATRKMTQDKQGLNEWMSKIEERDEDMMIMKKYIRQDDSKIKELELEMQRLTDNLREKKTKLDNIYIKTQTNQVALDRASEEARIAYNERDKLIAQWEQVINRMRERDEELRQFAQRLNEMHFTVDEQELALREREEFLQTQKEITTEAERRLVETTGEIAKHKLEMTESDLKRMNFLSELEALKRTVDKMASELESIRTKTSQLKKEKLQKTQKLAALQQLSADLTEKLDYVTQSKLTVEQLAQEADARLLADESNYEALAKYLNQLHEISHHQMNNYSTVSVLLVNLCSYFIVLLQPSHQFEELKSKSKILEQQFEGARASLRMLNSKLAKLDAQLLRHQEVIYKEDFHLQQLERRISRMRGEQNEEEKTALEEQVRQLNADLEQRTKTVTILTNELSSLKGEVYRVKKEASTLQERHNNVENRMKTNELEVDIATREKAKMETVLHRLLVEQNLLRLEVRRLHGIYERHANRAAQEKEELQQRGDALDVETRRAEQEVIALENTLAVMNGCNQVYRMSHAKLPEDSEELRLDKELREEHQVLTIKLRYDMDKLCELRQTEQDESIAITREMEPYLEQIEELTQELERKNREIMAQRERLTRAQIRLKKAIAKAEQKEPSQLEPIRSDIQVRMLKEYAEQLTRDTLNCVKSDEQIVDQAQILLSASGIPYQRMSGLRSRRGSQFSSASSHVTSPSIARSPASSGTVTPVDQSRVPSARSMDSQNPPIKDLTMSGVDVTIRSSVSTSTSQM
ncbi:unnamed protein product [Echinostoma caproni]|uniref:Coiled-coil domain-containing protein 39 n=1 Tax=Echinostoma caproni TaxID=27848 RepID=A0A183A915_9TREM|nr:unnamed protein product [Echinostoma caproni]